jgi:hypothetical protein
MSNNFTYLDDIIDMDEPGNENESNNFNQRPQPSQQSHSFSKNSHREQYNKNSYTPEIITENRNLQQYQTNLAPSSNLTYRMRNLNDPAAQSFKYEPEQQYTQPISLPVYTSQSDMGMDINSSEYVNNYNELCEICMKINNKNNMMFHYIYIMIIITLIIIMLMLLKKVLNI